MEEIEVGEYIRTYSKIRRITNPNFYMSQYVECGEDIVWRNDIVKHSKNIIDLIEVGDYVNGKLVSNVDKIDKMNFIEWNDGDMYKTEIQNDKFIKSIVTHQQFASMEYKVGE